MSYQYIIGAISCSENTAYTGSFVKLQAVHENVVQELDDKSIATASLSNITWGQFPGSGDISDGDGNDTMVDGTLANGGKVTVPVGSYIDGPIYSFKTMTNGGGWLAYYLKK